MSAYGSDLGSASVTGLASDWMIVPGSTTGFGSDSVSVSAIHSEFGSRVEIARPFVFQVASGLGFATGMNFASDSTNVSGLKTGFESDSMSVTETNFGFGLRSEIERPTGFAFDSRIASG